MDATYDPHLRDGHNLVPSAWEFNDSVLQGLPLSEVSARLDREVNNALKYIASVQRVRNHRCIPIARLPNEILTRIFAIASTFRHSRDCLNLGHVCQHWRTVIFNDPLLWNQIHVEFNLDFWDTFGFSETPGYLPKYKRALEKAALFFERSCETAVEVCFTGFTVENADDHVLDLVARHGHRFSKLELGSSDHVAMQRVLSHVSQKCDLKHLSIDMPIPSSRPVLHFTMTECHPQSISLSGAVLSFKPPVDLGLRKLRVTRGGGIGLPNFTADWIIPVLRGCPDLEDLTLDEDLLPSPESYSQHIELLRLRRLLIEDSSSAIASLLSHLVLPESLYISIRDSREHSVTNNVLQQPRCNNFPDFIRQVLSSHHDIVCLTQITSLLVYMDMLWISFKGKREEGSEFDVWISSLPGIEFWETASRHRRLAGFFSIASIQSLILRYTYFFGSTEDFTALFQELPQLSTLVLDQTRRYQCEGVPLIIKVLGGEALTDPLLCPKLRELEIKGLYCFESIEMGVVLRQNLASRSAKGAPRLKRLFLSRVMRDDSMLQLDLNGFCDEVVLKWEGSDDLDDGDYWCSPTASDISDDLM
ncbi:hypothetical protein NLI96_g11676 [Meripilus lineatus]|uniref:F-box domain-containing protein n=1 Tax=Meripilus lineatus TaxID=2056292 RepID=A0AAD5USX6_9APHY|nr:hypothetical protein NLI96_g11676 [Physisporinus lineatus]